MLKKFRNNLTHPKLAFLYMKDKFYQVFFYILFLTFIMSLPVIFSSFVNPGALTPSSNDVNYNLTNIINEGYEIKDGKFIADKTKILESNLFNIQFGEGYFDKQGFFLQFKEEELVSYYNFGQGITYQTKSKSYDELNLENFEFNANNKTKLTNIITLSFSQNKGLIVALTISSIFINFIDLIVIVLLLSLLANLTKRLPFKFRDHFKINSNIVTIYAIINLIFILFGINNLDFISLIIVYIFQMIAYRSIKIISKIQVKKKDE